MCVDLLWNINVDVHNRNITEWDNVVQLKEKMVGNSDNILLPIEVVHPGGQN